MISSKSKLTLKKRTFTDHLNNRLEIIYPPLKVISLVPSHTELLFDLGLTKEITGRTKFCIHPKEKVKSVPIVGGTKNFNIPKIRSINPDLIIANKEENYKEGIEELETDFPIWVSDIKELTSCLQMIQQVGEVVGKEPEGNEIAEKIKKEFLALRPEKRYTVAYLIWKNPYMTIGKDTFIHQMLNLAGFDNVFADSLRYPVISAEEIENRKPDLIFLSSEPYPFKNKHLSEFSKISPASGIKLVRGDLFSWHGSRLLYAARYFKKLQEEVQNDL